MVNNQRMTVSFRENPQRQVNPVITRADHTVPCIASQRPNPGNDVPAPASGTSPSQDLHGRRTAVV